jgi:hypothetical protein
MKTLVEGGEIKGVGEKKGWPRDIIPYNEENLRAEMRAIDPEKYDGYLNGSENALPQLIREMGFLAWANSYAGSTELMHKAYEQLKHGGLEYEA